MAVQAWRAGIRRLFGLENGFWSTANGAGFRRKTSEFGGPAAQKTQDTKNALFGVRRFQRFLLRSGDFAGDKRFLTKFGCFERFWPKNAQELVTISSLSLLLAAALPGEIPGSPRAVAVPHQGSPALHHMLRNLGSTSTHAHRMVPRRTKRARHLRAHRDR